MGDGDAELVSDGDGVPVVDALLDAVWLGDGVPVTVAEPDGLLDAVALAVLDSVGTTSPNAHRLPSPPPTYTVPSLPIATDDVIGAPIV